MHQGYKVTEIPVNHRPRLYGESKYGASRFLTGFIDIFTIITITKFSNKPAHLLGTLGMIIGFIGLVSLGYLSILWCLGLGPIGNRPLLLFGILAVTSALQLISLGVISELVIKNSHRPKNSDYIREVQE